MVPMNDQVFVREHEQQQYTNKKKKCRGNRKLQRFRRKCRKNGMNNDTIEMIIENQQANKSFHSYDQDIESLQTIDDTFNPNIDNDIISLETEVKSEFRNLNDHVNFVFIPIEYDERRSI